MMGWSDLARASTAPIVSPTAWLDDALADLHRAGLHRELRQHRGAAGTHLDLDVVSADGSVEVRRVLHLSGNSYLGLSDDPRVVGAASDAARSHGVGAGASRLVTGGTDLHRALEHDLASLKGAEDALLFSSGYLANLGVLTALAGRGDTIVSDQLNHASIIDACRLSGAHVEVYPHADVDAASVALRQVRTARPDGRIVLVTDGVFSMDGDLAPLDGLCDAAEEVGAMVVVDDAHGTGVVGPGGRGSAAAVGATARVDATVVTLSKAFGAQGGAVTGSARLIDWVRNRARPFIFDTALAPTAVAAAHEALRISLAEPWRRERARAHARRITAAARELPDVQVPTVDAAIVPIVLGTNDRALGAMAALLDRGVLVVAIRPPSVPAGQARLRVTTMGTHDPADLDHAIAVLRDVLAP